MEYSRNGHLALTNKTHDGQDNNELLCSIKKAAQHGQVEHKAKYK